MGIQHEIKQKQALLKKDGTLTEAGWSRKPFLEYRRGNIHAATIRIKEWDYFYILDDSQSIGITFTLSDLGAFGFAAIAFLNFKTKTSYQLNTMTLLPLGKIGLLPHSGNGTVAFEHRKLLLSFDYRLPNRTIKVDAPKFCLPDGTVGLKGEITLFQDPDMESMVIASSWKKRRAAFYYNQKINCMPAKGSIIIGKKKYRFSPETAMGGLDWGRGVWTYQNRWYWGSLSTVVNGKPFGFNIGYGFSDRKLASENAIFYDGKVHKLNEVKFIMDKKDYMKPWQFTSNDNRFKMNFIPCIDRSSTTNLLLVKSVQHQVFGYFDGEVVLDDGAVLTINSALGFAEDVFNRW